MNKAAVFAAVLARLEEELASATREALAASDAATDPDSKAESKYDTRALEASYLARGQARRVAELTEALVAYRELSASVNTSDSRVALGSCVRLTVEGSPVDYVVGPAEGGTEVLCDGVAYTLITPASPLGRRMLGLRVGETLPAAPSRVPWVVAGIC